jgi:hypothetical protein
MNADHLGDDIGIEPVSPRANYNAASFARSNLLDAGDCAGNDLFQPATTTRDGCDKCGAGLGANRSTVLWRQGSRHDDLASPSHWHLLPWDAQNKSIAPPAAWPWWGRGGGGNDKGEAARKAVDKLIRAGLLEEVPAAGSVPVWRRDDDSGAMVLRITESGLKAIDTEGEAVATPKETSVRPISSAVLWSRGSPPFWTPVSAVPQRRHIA